MRAAARRLVLVAAAVPLLVLATAPTASAHPTLLDTTPEAGYSVASAPDRVTMVFDEPVAVDARGVRVVDDHGAPVQTSEVLRDQGRRRLAVQLLTHLHPGRYVVRWQVTAQDGDVVDSGFDFAIATSPAGLHGQDRPETAGFPLVVALRWLLFLALAGVVGGRIGERIARQAVRVTARPRSLVQPAALLGLVAVAGLLTHLLITTGAVGRAVYLLGVEAVGLAVAAAVANRWRWWAVPPPALVVIVAEAFRNHLGTERGVVGALVLVVHLFAVASWVGALIHLLRVARLNRSSDVQLGAMFAAYARTALVLFLAVAASGTVGALLLVPRLSDLVATTYGWVLIAKLTLVAGVAVLAWVGRRRLARTQDRAESLVRPARSEAAALVAVLVVTAALVSLPTPAPATQDLGYPPPVTGPVIRLGTLAGQVAVGVAASENQIEIRLRIPDDRVQTGDAAAPDFRVTAQVSDTALPAATVALRLCGPGCFTGPVQWRPGTKHVEVRVDTPGWHGGTAVFPIPWPPQPTQDAVPRIANAMRIQRAIRITETVTSDTTVPGPPARPVTTNGTEFLESEPYGNSPALDTTVLPSPTGITTVAFGLPAEGIHVQLEVDIAHRIVRETLTAPKHLIRRTFTYP